MSHPEMSEEQKLLCEKLIEQFKKKLLTAAEDVLATVYCDILPHIEHDLFYNFKSDAMSNIRGYASTCAKTKGDYTGLEIRNQIFEEHKAEIIECINQDHLARIEQLKEDLKREREYNSRRFS